MIQGRETRLGLAPAFQPPGSRLLSACCCAAASRARPAPATSSPPSIHPPIRRQDGWQAGTCSEEPPKARPSARSPPRNSSSNSAAGHPNWGFTQFIVKTQKSPGEKPVGELEDVRVDLPVGLSVNPGATALLRSTTFEAGASGCPARPRRSAKARSPRRSPAWPADAADPRITQVPVYNLIPPQGEPARFGLELAGNEVFLEADVAWDGDYHEGFTIAVPKALADLEPLIEGLILKNRLVFNGRAGRRHLHHHAQHLPRPAATPGPSGQRLLDLSARRLLRRRGRTRLRSSPPSAEPRFESPIPPGTSPKECATIPYDPSIAVDPGTAETDSPAGGRGDYRRSRTSSAQTNRTAPTPGPRR